MSENHEQVFSHPEAPLRVAGYCPGPTRALLLLGSPHERPPCVRAGTADDPHLGERGEEQANV